MWSDHVIWALECNVYTWGNCSCITEDIRIYSCFHAVRPKIIIKLTGKCVVYSLCYTSKKCGCLVESRVCIGSWTAITSTSSCLIGPVLCVLKYPLESSVLPADEASADGHLFTLVHHAGGLAGHNPVLVVPPGLAGSTLHPGHRQR